MWLGAWMLRLDEALSLKWVKKMKVLTVVFDIVSFEENNWQQKINQQLEKSLISGELPTVLCVLCFVSFA